MVKGNPELQDLFRQNAEAAHANEMKAKKKDSKEHTGKRKSGRVKDLVDGQLTEFE
eukprot:CAMPEP_0185758954 /NCGR_PEP_ID=MMETSP1174-20130828/17649_1 /TAXON_ID=35687 /ORGANISM="Dictyocha speculum, Strain CCMP1381" /LENGTH=55 /DNA_ID=CAMNT_0028439049 /DNA_START=6 /DNA_END=170 /DNA_ORIENTATION=+